MPILAAPPLPDRIRCRAQHAQTARYCGYYAAVNPSAEEAFRYVAGAGDFIASVDEMLAA